MTQQRWDAPDLSEDDAGSPERAAPTLVSLHFIRSALRRRWLVCVLSPVLGLLLAVAFLVAMPPAHKATASLVLTHDPQVDPSRAMATDVSLLRTRTAAAMTVATLGLSDTPEDFLKSVTAVPVSSELMTLTLSAPSDAEAVRRLDALTSIYLTFRGDQLSRQSDVLIGSMQQRITRLSGEVKILSRQIDDLSAAGNSSADKLSDAIAQRAYVQGRIETLQQSAEDMTLQTTAVVSSSRVIDPAAAETGGAKKRIVLTLASGIIGGAAFGWGTVLFFAIISDRLRRRSDIAEALDLAVPVSVRRIAPLPQRSLRIPYLRKLDGRRAVDRQRLAHAIEMELPEPGRQGRLAIACIDNADEVSFAVSDAATDLAASGLSVAVIDLTQQGKLAAQVASAAPGSSNSPLVLRPAGIPELASTADLRAVGREDSTASSIDGADVLLVLADLEPSIGAEYLTAWTDRVIVAVTSGRSSAERLRTAADLSRAVGLDLRFAALLRAERTDDSLGGTIVHTDSAPVAHEAQLAAVPATDVSERDGELTADEQEWADALSTDELEWAEGLPADESEWGNTVTGDDQEWAEAVAEESEAPEALTTEDEATPEDLDTDIETIDEQPEVVAQPLDHAEDQPVDQVEEPQAEVQPVDQVEEPQAEVQPADQVEEPQAEVQPADQVEEPQAEVQPADQVEEPQAEVQPLDHAEAQPLDHVAEQPLEHVETQAPEQVEAELVEAQLVEAEQGEAEQGEAHQDQPAKDEVAPETELVAEPDPAVELPDPAQAVNGWFVDTAANPLSPVGSVPSPDSDEFDWSWDWSLDDADTAEQEAAEAEVEDDESEEKFQAGVEPALTSNGSEPDWVPTWSDEESERQQEMDGWRLYIDEYPLVHVGSASEDAESGEPSHHHHGNGQASNGVRRRRSRSRSRRRKSGLK